MSRFFSIHLELILNYLGGIQLLTIQEAHPEVLLATLEN